MKTLTALAVAGALVVLGAGAAAAQEVVQPKPAAVVPTLTGDVVKVIPADRIVLLKTADGKEVRLSILPDARILVNRKVTPLNELAVGVPVRVLYTDRAGTFQVSSIESPVAVAPGKAVVAEPVVVPAVPAVVVAGGSMRGMVMEGDRPQPDLAVSLRTQEGKVVASTRTALDGTFAFNNVAPGTYVTYADKISSQTKGESLVTIKSGKTLANVVVNLIRPPLP